MYLLENVFGMRGSALIRNRLAFSFVFAVFLGLIFTRFYGQLAKKIWRIVWDGKTMRVYFGGALRKEFLLADLQKIHINGWFKEENKSSYRWLRLTINGKKLLMIAGNTALVNTTTPSEITTFDDFLAVLETYAVRKKYPRTDLKKGYHYSFGKNHYYLKDRSL